MPSRPTFRFENAAMARGHAVICGLDEAGCGPWAGPVVAAAVVLNRARVPKGLNDSKKLTPEQRAALFDEIQETAQVGVALATAAHIDRDNILVARLWAMGEALRALSILPAYALVDGNRMPALPCPAEAIVDGDALSPSIAAASIIAKVTRDRMMEELDREFPGYGFAAHKGYGTPAHSAALARLGPCREHRKTFAPVAALLTPAESC